MPPSLMIEGVAQTAGILVGEAKNFQENVILAKIRQATFDDYAMPGDQLRYDVTLESLDDRAGVTAGTVYKNDEKIGQVDMIFSHVNQAESTLELPSHNFVFTPAFLDLLSAFRSKSAKDDGAQANG